MTDPIKYSPLARILHWSIAGMIVSQFILAKLAERAEDNDQLLQQLALLANHKSIGMTIVMLAVVRIIWRFTHRPPVLPSDLPVWQHRASAVVHWILYGLIFAIPISGWLMSSATAYSVSWFNLFSFPDLVSPNEELAHLLHQVHETLAKSLFVIAVLHILAALKHRFIDKDQVLARMSSAAGWILFIATIAIAVGMFGRISPSSDTTQINRQHSNELAHQHLAPASSLAVWEIDYSDSHIRFSGEQAGAPFTGEWQSWIAEMQFDPDRLDESRFDVVIQVDSVFSDDATRDEAIVGVDFFDQPNFPEVRYQANQFSKSVQGSFTASGLLTIKGLQKSAPLVFRIEQHDNKTVLTGTATIDRLSWNVGMGDWTDTTWVGKDVQVEVRVVAMNKL